MYHLVHDHGQQHRDRRAGGDRLGRLRRRRALAGRGRRRSSGSWPSTAPASRSGKRFEIKQPRLPKLVWEVTEVEPGVSWTWRQRSPGGTDARAPRGRRAGRRAHARAPAHRPAGPARRRRRRAHPPPDPVATSTSRPKGLEGAQRAAPPPGCLARLTTGDARSCSTPSSTRSPTAASAAGRCGRSPRRSAPATACCSTTSGRATSCCCRSWRRSSAARPHARRPSPTSRPTPSPPCGPTSAGPSCGRSSGCSSSATRAAPRARRRSRASSPAAVDGWLAEVDERTRRHRRSGAGPARASPSCAACCSTSSPPATTRAWTPPPRIRVAAAEVRLGYGPFVLTT